MKNKSLAFIFIFILTILFGFSPATEKPLKIALSKASPNYIKWIKADSTIIVVDLNNLEPADAVRKLEGCDALVLTGGGDIDPSFYRNEDQMKSCTDVDPKRDKLELALINKALLLKMPVLGICRGEQILNVALKGTLIPDIPAYKRLKLFPVPSGDQITVQKALTSAVAPVQLPDDNHKSDADVVHQCDDYLHCFHPVSLDPKSLLCNITGTDTGTVTTNHHQAILKLGEGLKMDAMSPDSIIEGIEWIDAKEKSFLIGVQWHPERMDISNSLSGKLLLRFIAEAKKYDAKLQNVK